MLVDLHIHSRFSDGKLSIAEIVDLFGSRGFGAIAITDHLTEKYTPFGKCARLFGRSLTEDTFFDYIAAIGDESKRAMREYGMRVIPGVEVSKNYIDFNKSSHILGIGIEKYLFADTSCESIIEAIHELGGIAVGAHPVYAKDHSYQTYYLWNHRQRMSGLLDAWEAANRTSFFREVYTSGSPVVASSDLHRDCHLEGWKTVLSCERERDAIFDAIRKRNCGFIYYRDHIRIREERFSRELRELEEKIAG